MTFVLLRCLLQVVALVPAVVWGAEGARQAENYSFLSSFLQMIAALGLVLGLILLVYYGSTRLLRKLPVLSQGNRNIRVVEVKAMGPRKALVLVEVGGEYLLLASSGDQLTYVKSVDMLEEIELVAELPVSQTFRSLLKRAISRPEANS